METETQLEIPWLHRFEGDTDSSPDPDAQSPGIDYVTMLEELEFR